MISRCTRLALISLFSLSAGMFSEAEQTSPAPSFFSDSFANTAVGRGALAADDPMDVGDEGLNTAVGDGALSTDQTGYGNVGVGVSALYENDGTENVAIGLLAMYSNISGNLNTAVGTNSLEDATGSYNTGVGASVLQGVVDSDGHGASDGGNNTAIGYEALENFTSGSYDTAVGSQALVNNTSGRNNTAAGYSALASNTTGGSNTATGYAALDMNTTGGNNTAYGVEALYGNLTGVNNTADGVQTSFHITSGNNNAATGRQALFQDTTGSNNTAHGFKALLSNTTGSSNIALGASAGSNLTTGSNNIDIGSVGVAAEANTTRLGTVGTHKNAYMAGISGVTVASGVGVIVDSKGHLGTVTSSEKFKENIKSMDATSEAILALHPVTFNYKPDLDPDAIPQYGLVAEQVANVNPALVARDADGKIYTVRYDAVNAMLLNEFLKEHAKVEQLESSLGEQKTANAQLQAAVAGLSARLDKVDGSSLQK